MKPETKQWLDKLTPLLVHVHEGGKLNYKGMAASLHDLDNVIQAPEAYSIHVEPRVVYLIKNEDGTLHHGASLTDPGQLLPRVEQKNLVRFIEDLDWKPEGPRKAQAVPWEQKGSL